MVAFARLLRQRRYKARLTRKKLAALAGLTDSTIRNIEEGRHVPTRKTCLRLYVVDALRLRWADLEPIAGPAPHVAP